MTLDSDEEEPELDFDENISQINSHGVKPRNFMNTQNYPTGLKQTINNKPSYLDLKQASRSPEKLSFKATTFGGNTRGLVRDPRPEYMPGEIGTNRAKSPMELRNEKDRYGLRTYRSSSPNDRALDNGSQQGQQDYRAKPPLLSPRNPPQYQHIQSKYSQTDKAVKKLRKEKMEVHQSYQVKKALANERCGNQFFNEDPNVI